MEPLVQLLAEMVSIPSMNPMGRPRSGTDYTEQRLAEFVAEYLRRAGLDVQLQEVAPNRPNVLATMFRGARTTMLLEAHLDTVHADNMAIPPFTPEIRNDALYGRGSCDTKGSLAACMFAAAALAQQGKKLRHNLILAAAADEEYRFSGARHLVNAGLRADFGIVGEPTQLHIVRAHKGVMRWRTRARGLAAHSAYPERGENAIYRMAHALIRLEEYARTLPGAVIHPLLGSATLSVGVIEGGEAVNIVPESCTIEVDRRILPGETPQDVLEPVRLLLEDLEGVTLEEPHIVAPGMEVPAESPLITMLASAIRAVTGDAVVETANYATDAGVYSGAGIPSVVFGPGDISFAHTAVENIPLAQLRQAADIITKVFVE
jgi:acetylornithine deacetylase/succinyl-diaminopimelate desuccinylase family protein